MNPDATAGDTHETQLNELQEAFVDWNAKRLRTTRAKSRDRLLVSVNKFKGGHGGRQFRRFNGLSYEVMAPFFSDSEKEIEEAYRFHSHMHFLRMLSYDFKPWNFAEEMLDDLARNDRVTVIDYGCGLAHGSRWIAAALKARGIGVSLALVDFPTIRKDFLIWLCDRDGIDMKFHDAQVGGPVTDLPQAQTCIATEFFEHVRKPEKYFSAIDKALVPGGWLITNVNDHREEFMHVSPDLQTLRNRIETAGYAAKDPARVLVKPA